MANGDNKILYKNHCDPQEKVGANDRYYHDGDSGRTLSGSYELALGNNTTIAATTITSTTDIGTGNDFIAIKAVDIDSGTVLISLDNGDTHPIKLLEGECFASEIASSVDVIVTMSGTATVEYFTGT